MNHSPRFVSREVISPQDIALRIQNTLSYVSIIIETEKKVQINYSIVVNTAGRYTGTFFFFIQKAFYD